MAETNYQSVDEYIALQDPDKQFALEELRQLIRSVLPTAATEVISYQIPIDLG